MTTVFIDGLGFIGASLAELMKESQPDVKIIAHDPNPENLQVMIQSGTVEASVAFDEGAKKADWIFLASPVAVICQRLEELAKLDLKSGAVVTDVGSSKVQIEKSAQALMAKGTAFLAGHPMAGSHLSGAANANPGRLVDHTYFLIQENTSQEEVQDFEDLLSAARFDFRMVDAKSHDHIVASSSHLPHLLAFALAETVAKDQRESDVDWGKPAAGFLDASRIAKADPTMWTSIFLSNPNQVLAEITDFEKEVQKLKKYIENGQEKKLFNQLSATQKDRIQMEKEHE